MIFLTGVGVTAVQMAGNPSIRSLDPPSRYTANLTTVIGIGVPDYAFAPSIISLKEKQARKHLRRRTCETSDSQLSALMKDELNLAVALS